MAIPKDILAVERPVNTIVFAYGKEKNLYAVKQRIGCKRKDGRNLPVTGATIGHIVDHVYVPIDGDILSVRKAPITLKDWANVKLCMNLSADIREEIGKFYSKEDADKIYTIAILRVCDAGIKDYQLKAEYEESFLSEEIPSVALSKNTVCEFINNLGKSYSRIVSFMQYKVSSVCDNHHLLIDGTLKSDESNVNSLSDYSRKAKDKGKKDISLLYAYDLEKMEPVASKCFPGNMLDLTAYEGFVSEYKITKGILVGDKGFPSNSIENFIRDNDGLHYINPLKRNSAYIKELGLYTYQGIFGENNISYCKARSANKGKGEEDKYLYLFRDNRLAQCEEKTWLEKRKKNNNFDNSEWEEAKPQFGTILLESDLDLDASVIYNAYSERWKIELVMRYYKSACDLDETRVHDDYSVIGGEFINFFASQISARLINLLDSTQLSDKYSYSRFMRILEKAKKARTENESNWYLVKLTPSYVEVLQKIGLLEKANAETPVRRGRPKKKAI